MKIAPTVGWVGEGTFQGRGRRGGASYCPHPARGSTSGQVLSMTSSNNVALPTCLSFPPHFLPQSLCCFSQLGLFKFRTLADFFAIAGPGCRLFLSAFMISPGTFRGLVLSHFPVLSQISPIKPFPNTPNEVTLIHWLFSISLPWILYS